jgi:hypothetical protein
MLSPTYVLAFLVVSFSLIFLPITYTRSSSRAFALYMATHLTLLDSIILLELGEESANDAAHILAVPMHVRGQTKGEGNVTFVLNQLSATPRRDDENGGMAPVFVTSVLEKVQHVLIRYEAD